MKKEDFIKLGLSEEDAKKAADASAEELKTYIPKSRFDEVNTEKKNLETTVKERNEQLETLKNSTGDVEGLKKKIADLQADNKAKDETHAAEIKQVQKEIIDNELLTSANAKNIKAVKGLLDDLDDGLDLETYKVKRQEQLEELTGSKDSKFLFDSSPTQKKMMGVVQGQVNNEKSDVKSDIDNMSYEELEKIMNDDSHQDMKGEI